MQKVVWEDIPEGKRSGGALVYCHEVNEGMGVDSGSNRTLRYAWHLEWDRLKKQQRLLQEVQANIRRLRRRFGLWKPKLEGQNS